MNKNAMAASFALIGLGVAGFIFEFSGISIILGLCIGGFVGYFFAGLNQAKGIVLQQDFVSMGTLVGKTLDEIKSKAGEPSEFSACTVGDTGNPGSLHTWSQAPYSITLLFDENNICLGVNREITGK